LNISAQGQLEKEKNMKIVRNDKPGYKLFCELEIGDVFIEEVGADECVQMKTDEGKCGSDPINTVLLFSGELSFIEPLQLVRLVEAELVIK
jgi:hypothetical protein